MKYISYPLDNTLYTAEGEQLYASVFSDGVYLPTDFLVSVKSGMIVTVSPGRANFNYDNMKGFIFGSYDPVDLTIDIGDSVLNRIDRVVLRHNFVTNLSSIAILKGTPASNPVAPSLVRDTTTYYDLCVAEIRVNAGTITLTNAMISDKRLVEELCGIVASKVDKIPTEGLTQQWQGWFDSNTQAFETSFEAWFANLKNQLTTNQAANLQNQIDTINTQFEENSNREITTDAPMTTLTGSTDGIINLKSIKGKTRYKKADGTYTDTWESGVTLESVGEAETNKNVIKSVGKNLTSVPKNLSDIIFNFRDSAQVAYDELKTTITGVKNQYCFCIAKTFKVKPDTKYTLSVDGFKDVESRGVVRITYKFDSDVHGIGEVILDTSRSVKQMTFNSANHTEVSILYYPTGPNSSGINMYIYSIQLEEGTTSTPHEPYTEDKTEIQLDDSLKGFATYQDEILPNENKLINRTIARILNGTENWTLYKQSSTILSVHFETTDGLNGTRVMLADKFKNLTLDELEGLTEEGVFAGSGTNAMSCFLNIAKSKLSTQDVAGVKAWLVNNNAKIVYALKTPIEKNIYPSTLRSFKGGSLILENAITPSVTLDYTTNISSRLDNLEKMVDLLGENRSEYEFGKWTPVIGLGQTGTVIPCIADGSYYERVNNKVTAYFRVSVQNWNTSNVNEILIMTGFPFPINLDKVAIGEISEYGGVATTAQATGGLAIYRQGVVYWLGKRTTQTVTSMIINNFDKNFYFLGKAEYTL